MTHMPMSTAPHNGRYALVIALRILVMGLAVATLQVPSALTLGAFAAVTVVTICIAPRGGDLRKRVRAAAWFLAVCAVLATAYVLFNTHHSAR